jgi:hypothetical protein
LTLAKEDWLMANRSCSLGKASLCFVAILMVASAGSRVEAAAVRAKVPPHRVTIGRVLLHSHKPAKPLAFTAKPAKRPVVAARPAAKPAATRQRLLARLRTLPREAFRAPPPRDATRAVVPILAHPAAVSPPAPPPALLTVRPDAPVLLAQRGDWSVFRASLGDTRTCFAATQPKDSAPRLLNRTPVYLYLTSYVPGGIRDEMTVKLGFVVPPGSSLTATINGRGYRLAAKGDVAFPADAGSQRSLLDAMRHGAALQLMTVARDGSQTMTDAFSLLGLAAALQDTTSACAKAAGP